MENEYVYKILNTKTGLFSSGTTYLTFKKRGKIWKTLPHVKAHLRMLNDYYTKDLYKDCVVVEYQVIPTRNIILEELNKK